MLIESVVIIALALLLDAMLGEFRCCHPLVGFGNAAKFIEAKLNSQNASHQKMKGMLGVSVLVLPILGLLVFIQYIMPSIAIEIFILYLAIGRKSLHQHALNIMRPLTQNKLSKARKNIGNIVSRDTATMNEQQITTACIESVIENSSDAIYATLFWFVILGAPGALLYRLSNTLDAMWGYKNNRFLQFGWAAAKFDDYLNWLPARLSVLSFALLSGFSKVWRLAFEQGMKCSSKNAGPVMAAGACALNIKLGGDASYQGVKISKPELGCGKAAEIKDIKRALTLIDKALVLWVLVLIMLGVFMEMI